MMIVTRASEFFFSIILFTRSPVLSPFLKSGLCLAVHSPFQFFQVHREVRNVVCCFLSLKKQWENRAYSPTAFNVYLIRFCINFLLTGVYICLNTIVQIFSSAMRAGLHDHDHVFHDPSVNQSGSSARGT